MEKTIILTIVFGAIGLLAWKMKKFMMEDNPCNGCGSLKKCRDRSCC